MRSFIISLVIAAVIIGTSLMYSSHLDKVSDYMVEQNQKISEYVEEEQFEKAAEEAGHLEEYIDKQKFTLAATINHESLDKIEMHMAQMKKYVESEQKADSLANCEVLDMLFGHLPKNYRLKLENVL